MLEHLREATSYTSDGHTVVYYVLADLLFVIEISLGFREPQRHSETHFAHYQSNKPTSRTGE